MSKLCMSCMNEIEGNGVCDICGFDEANEPNGKGLMPLRSVLTGSAGNKYVIGRVIDSNGEGATYKAYDVSSKTVVRIREYCPVNLCSRDEAGALIINIGDEGAFGAGKKSFEDLAKNLRDQNDLPALVPIVDIISANNTVYYVTENYDGITLREFIVRNSGALKWEQIKPLFLPIISTLKALHSVGIFHMGISPETLIVCRDGKLRLVGFCIKEARTTRNSINGQLYPGFAAIEQYGTEGNQGPWTDVYGFAATIYRTVVGNPPLEATERVTNDNMTIPAKIAQSLPQQVMIALANALQILPEDRTESITEFRAELLASENSAIMSAKNGKKSKKKSRNNKYGIISAIATAVILAVSFILVWVFFLKDTAEEPTPSNSGIAPPPMSSSISTSYPDTVTLYQVPDVVNYTYAETIANPEFQKNFEIEIVSLGFNDNYARGTIYEQSPVAGENVAKGTVVQVRISLGPELLSTGNLVGMKYEDAYVRLLELGFIPKNIIRVDVNDPYVPEGVITHMEPAASEVVSPVGSVTLHVNVMQTMIQPESQIQSPTDDTSSQLDVDGTTSE